MISSSSVRSPVCHRFDGPVSALHCDDDAIVFAKGNEIHGCAPNSRRGWGAHRISCLPCGAVVVALARAGRCVVIGAGDRLFVALWNQDEPSEDGSCTMAAEIKAFEPNGRITALTFQRGVFAALTSRNILLTMRKETVEAFFGRNHDVAVHVTPGPSMPLLLAADVLVLPDDSCAVFAGTYGGSVSVWTSGITHEGGTPAIAQHPQIAAHTSSCAALFAVKAVYVTPPGGTCGGGSFLVATCSDDRSAAVFLSDSLSHPWQCIHRECGPRVASTRIFTVALLLANAAAQRSDDSIHVSFAVGTEDGAVLVRDVTYKERHEGNASVLAVRTTFENHAAHRGRGTTAVGVFRSGEATLVVSGGFDGSVVVSRTRTRRCTEPMDGIVRLDRQQVEDPPTGVLAARQAARRSIRCVAASPALASCFFCVEDALYCGSPDDDGESNPRCLCSWSNDAKEYDKKALYPTALAVSTQGNAFIGTEGGHLLVYCPDAEPPAVVRFDVWSTLRKCVMLRTVARSAVDDSAGWLLSSHAGGSVVVTAAFTESGAVVVANLSGCNGLEVTCMQLCVESPEYLVAVVGDKRGYVRIYRVPREITEGASAPSLSPVAVHRAFSTPVHTVAIEQDGRTEHHQRDWVNLGELVYAASDGGTFALLSRRSTEMSVDLAGCPLRFPFDATRVLSFLPGCCIAQHGTAVHVYHSRRPDHVWHRVAELPNIKAPRLVHVDVDAQRLSATVTHCSDGRVVESFRVAGSPWGASDDGGKVYETNTIQTSGCTGKDFNCTLMVPEARVLVHGNEDSSISIQRYPRASEEAEPAAQPYPPNMVVKGPHNSNILAIAAVPRGDETQFTREESPGTFRFITVGGLSTAAVWEWDGPSRVLRVVGRTAFAPGEVGKLSSSSDEKVPRYMSVAALSESMFLVGSSDASLCVLHLCTRLSHGGVVLTLESLTLLSALTETHPKPIMALCVVDTSASRSLILAGDTNGRVFLVSVARTSGDVPTVTVLSEVRVEQSCVNALTRSSFHTAPGCYLAAAALDSGNVALLCLEEGSAKDRESGSSRAPTWSCVTIVDVHSTGVTAGRGVAWARSRSHGVDGDSFPRLLAVNEERLVVFEVVKPKTASDSLSFSLRPIQQSRVTVRCVSGMDVGWHEKTDVNTPSHVMVVVGQGIETITLT